jgi:hypothetical protein
MNEPVTGITVAISPRDCLQMSELTQASENCSPHITKKTIMPTKEKLISEPAGPPSCNAFPELTSNPGPMIPNTIVSFDHAVLWLKSTSNGNHL